MTHSMRAILFASAMAASMRGLRARMRPSHEFSAGGRTSAPEITAIAPMINKRRMSRCPDLLVRPSLCLPPLECCRGTRPSQAEKSRPCRNVSIRFDKLWRDQAHLVAQDRQAARPVMSSRACFHRHAAFGMRLHELKELFARQLLAKHNLTFGRCAVQL